MSTISRFEDLEVWKLSRELAHEIYAIYTGSESFSRDYRLKDQMNGSSGSIMDNIAEGFERGSRNELINFLTFSKGSVGELQSQLFRAFDRKYISEEKFNYLYRKAGLIGRRIGAFIVYLNGSAIKGLKYKNRQEK